MQKVFLALLAIVLLVILAPAAAQETYTVSTRTARVRAEANTSSDVIATLRRGDAITVLEVVEGARVSGSTVWYRIDVSGETGYIHSSLVGTATPSNGSSGGSSGGTNTGGGVSAAPSGGTSNLSCGTCGQMSSCDQAYACLAAGHGRLDRDKDGVPCESICPGG